MSNSYSITFKILLSAIQSLFYTEFIRASFAILDASKFYINFRKF